MYYLEAIQINRRLPHLHIASAAVDEKESERRKQEKQKREPEDELMTLCARGRRLSLGLFDFGSDSL